MTQLKDKITPALFKLKLLNISRKMVNKSHTQDPRDQLGITLLVTMKYNFVEKSIGEGTFGKVKLGTHQLTGEKVNSNF